jgi:hypothetical protein
MCYFNQLQCMDFIQIVDFLSRYHLNTKNVAKSRISSKCKFCKPKNRYFGVLNVISYSAWLFFSKLYYFFIFLMYIGYFLCFTLMAKKTVSKVRGEFPSKKYFVFLHFGKKFTVYIMNKKRIFNIPNCSRKI